MLGATQSDHNTRRLENEKDTENINKILAEEKRQREKDAYNQAVALAQAECEFIKNSEFINESPITQVNSLGAHRVKPYHFKGFNDEKKQRVLDEREIQLKEQQMMKKQAAEEERQYAIQQEHLRRQQIINDRKMKNNHHHV